MQNKDLEENKETKESKKGKIMTTVIVFILLLTGIVVACIVFKGEVTDIMEEYLNIGIDKNLGDADKKSQEEIQKELNKKVEEGMMNVTMNTNIVLENGKSKANLQVTNKDTNRYTQFIEIYTTEDNKLIYKSGGIPVGKTLNEAKFDTELKKGEYDCIAYFNGIEGGKIVGKVGVALKISVLK